MVDEEVRFLISEAYFSTQTLLREKLKELHLVANRLLEQEVLNTEDMVELLGDRQHGDSIKGKKFFNFLFLLFLLFFIFYFF